MRHFIFDLDGTIIDTDEVLLKTWEKTFAEYGYSYQREQLLKTMGLTMEKFIEKLGAKVDDAFPAKWEENYALFAGESEYFPGIMEVIKKLKKEGFKLGIVTSRNRSEYTKFFSSFKLEEYFDIIVLAEDTEKHKPDAEPILKYIELSGADASDCMYIGDMPGDIYCGDNAGIATGLARWKEDARNCDVATYYFDEPEDILEFIF